MKSKAQSVISLFKDLISREDATMHKNDMAFNSNTLLGKSNDPMSKHGSVFGNRNPMG